MINIEPAVVEDIPDFSVDDRIRTSRENMDMLSSLLNSMGWKFLQRIAIKQIEARKNDVFLKPLSDVNGAIAQEFLKGEATGMATLLALPQTLYDDAEATMTSLIKAKDEHADDAEVESGEGE
tara:strand:- start:125 stop:493 length:369 start_codon:yes stop_codon:yes gene_type:complete